MTSSAFTVERLIEVLRTYPPDETVTVEADVGTIFGGPARTVHQLPGGGVCITTSDWAATEEKEKAREV